MRHGAAAGATATWGPSTAKLRERLRVEKEDAVQDSVRNANDEIRQLKQTVATLRDELETKMARLVGADGTGNSP